MARYAFGFDLRKRVGCHACTIACKAVHDIPVGVNRCLVKTVEPFMVRGDIEEDTERVHAAYKEWMRRTRPTPGPDELRRPLWFGRPLRPAAAAYCVGGPTGQSETTV